MKPWQLRKLFYKVLVVLLCLAFLAQSSPLLAMSYEKRELATANQAKAIAARKVEQQGAQPLAALSANIVRVKPFVSTAPQPTSLQETAATWPEIRPIFTAKGAPIAANVTQTSSWSVDEAALLSGWNLVSLPKIPADSDPSAVLSGILGQTEVVFAYDGCQPDPWKVFDPAAPPATNDLTAIDQTKGFWLEANAATTLPFGGTLPPTTTIELCTGWNLIAMPAGQARPVRNALFSIDGKYSRVFGYEPEDSADPWTIYDTTAPDWANDLQMMEPGRGYWVLATENTTLTLANQGAPPIARLLSPDDLATEITTVTFITDVIGTAYSGFMESWTLSYRPESGTEWQPFATGTTPVITDTLDQFDPTLLLNGLFELELAVTDYEGVTALSYADVVVEGGAKVGHFSLQFTDVSIPVAGVKIEAIRTYDTRAKEVGDFGVGWQLSLSNVRLEKPHPIGDGWESALGNVSSNPILPFFDYCLPPTLPHVVAITFPDDTVYQFVPTISPECQLLIPHTIVDITYEPLPGTVGTLEPLDQSGENLLVVGGNPAPPLDFGDGPLGSFEPVANQFWNQDSIDLHDPQLFRLTLPNGRSFVVSENNGLQSITDRNGNVLTVSENGITHSSGKGITIERDEIGRITQITDPMSNTIHYTYDDNGDLVLVTDQLENTNTFEYNDDHRMIEMNEGRGIRAVRVDYDEDGRILRKTDANGQEVVFEHDLDAKQEIITDQLNKVTIVEYDESGNLIREVDPLGGVSTYDYNSFGQVISQTNELGHMETFNYDERSNLLSYVDPLGNNHEYEYNDLNLILSATDRNEQIFQYTYDNQGNRLTEQQPMGQVYTRTFNTSGEITSLTDPMGCTFQYEYNNFGDWTKIINPLGHITEFAYDENGNHILETTTRTLPSGAIETLVTEYEYDALNRLVKTTYPDGSFEQVEWNAINQMVAMVDELGRRTEYEYDSVGRLVRTIFPDGTSESLFFDGAGRRVSTSDRDEGQTFYLYDDKDRLTHITLSDGTVITRTYDLADRLIGQSDGRGNVTQTSYNPLKQPLVITDSLGFTTTMSYDENGNLISQVDANGHITSFEYDDNGRQTAIIYHDNTRLTILYDDAGRKVGEIDQAGNLTEFEYDCIGQLISVTDPLSNTTTFAYDEVGNLISQTDTNNHTMHFAYDQRGRVISHTLPLGQVETMIYDAVGNMTSHTDFNGNTTSYEYNENDMLVRKTFEDDSTVEYSYTDALELETVIDSRGTTTYTYDALNRLLSVTHPDSTVISYTYDNSGNRTSITTPIGTTTYSFDAINRLDSVTDPNDGITSYSYDPAGNLASLTYPNGTSIGYTLDSLNRITNVVNRFADNSIISSYDYVLDALGNRLQVADHNNRVVNYTYDDRSQLLQEAISDPISGSQTISYTYDNVGNRQTKTDNGNTVIYTYDANDRLLTSGDVTYDYDDKGRLIAETHSGGMQIDYSYDYEDQLVQAIVDNGISVQTVDYLYDHVGNRVQESINGTVTTNYLVDINLPYAQVLLETDGANQFKKSYVYGHELIQMSQAGNEFYYHYDGQGSTRQLSDASQIITDEYSYDAYGNLLLQTGSTLNNYLYNGEQFNPGTNTYYLRARYYTPSTGRFMSIDPFPGFIEEPMTQHPYLYVGNNPVNRIDPSGEMTMVETLTVMNKQQQLATMFALLAMSVYLAQVQTLTRVEVNRCAADLAYELLEQITLHRFDNPCDTDKVPTFWVGGFTHPDIGVNTALGFLRKPWANALLHLKRPGHGRGWMAGKPCPVLIQRDKLDCDEYPYNSTYEGGSFNYSKGWVNLLKVSPSQNRSHGAILRWLYAKCNRKDDGANGRKGQFAVIPIPDDGYLFTVFKCD